MAVTMDQVRAALDVDEPDYPRAAQQLGPEAAPQLAQLVREADSLLASKAAYLASLLGSAATDVVEAAAHHDDPVVRVASAAAAGNLSAQEAETALDLLLDDPDMGVRKAALRATGPDATATVRDHVTSLARSETDPALRPQIDDALGRLGGAAGPSRAGPTATLEREDGRGFGGGDVSGDDGSGLGAAAAAPPEVVEGHGGGDLAGGGVAGGADGPVTPGAGGGRLDGAADADDDDPAGQGGGDLGGGPADAEDGAGTGGGTLPPG